MSMLLPAMVVLLTCTFAASNEVNPAPVPGNEPPPVREIFVPFDALDVLLGTDARRVFLTRAEYAELLRRARRTPAEQAPLDVVVTAADYQATISDGRVTIAGTLDVDVLADGLHAVPLDLSGVGVRAATLDGQPAPLARDAESRVLLFVQGQRRHRLELQLVTPLQTAAAQQSMQFQIPTPPATRLQLTVPGNVEVRSGAAVAERTVTADGGQTRFDLLPGRGPLSLVLSLNNRQLLQQRLVVARSVLVGEVTQAYQRLHATVSLGVLHGAVDRFRFELPAGFEVTDVASPLLSRWQVAAGEADPARVLEVTLREPTTETVVLNISAVDEHVPLDDWSLPRLTPLDVASHVAVVGLLVDERLSAESIQATGLTPINNQILRSHLPATVFAAAPGAPRVREVVAYYAPDSEFQLSARFVRPPAQVAVVTHWLLVLDDERQTARGGFALSPTAENLFWVDIAQPPGWTIEQVTSSAGDALSFEPFAGADEADGGDEADGENTVRVRLPQSVAPGESFEVLFSALAVPAGWLDDWAETTVELPAFRVLGADSDRGAIAVQAAGDLSVRPDQIEGLAPLDANQKAQFGLSDAPTSLAYRYDAQPYRGVLQVARNTPWLAARTFNFLRIEPEALTAHYELIYEIRRARAQRLEFTLPESTPTTLSIRGLDGVAVKEYRSELAGGQRRWTVMLADRRLGTVRLAVDWEQPLPAAAPLDWQLPMVRAAGVEYQAAMVAVEGSPDFDVELATTGRKVDVGELADADYQVGPRLLGAFVFVDGESAVEANVFRRPGYGLPAAIVQRAEMVSLLSTGGRTQTAARYLLRTKAAYLEIGLPDPDRTRLWSASVDGIPTAPQRDGDQLLLSLPSRAGDTLRDLQIVYESSGHAASALGDVAVAAPRLMVRNESGDERYEVPSADIQWTLVLPSGHRIVRERGGVSREPAGASVSPVARVGKTLFLMSGGMQWLLSARMASTHTVDDRMTFSVEPGSAFDAEAASVRQLSEESMEYRGVVPPPASPQVGGEQVDESVVASESQPQAETGRSRGRAAGDFDLASPLGFEQADRPAESSPEPANGPIAAGVVTARSVADKREAGPQYWALEGVRSLLIEIQSRGDPVVFEGMGDHPRLQVTLIQEARLHFLGWGLALLIVLVGLLLTGRSAAVKTRYVVVAGVLALVLPLLIGATLDLDVGDTFAPAFYASSVLVPFYVLAWAWNWAASGVRELWSWRRRSAGGAAVLLLLAMTPAAFAQAPTAEQLQDLLDLFQTPVVQLPADAVIIPYDGDDPNQARKADKVLVPYERYTELWELAYPYQPLGVTQPPAQFAWAGASYEAALLDADSLTINGRIAIDVFTDEPVDVPLRLHDAVLTRATVDGRPAQIRVVMPAAAAPAAEANASAQPAAQQAARPAPSQAVGLPQAADPAAGALAVLRIQGQGRRTVEVSLRLRLERSGGWRIVQGVIPAAPAASLTLTVPAPQTEVRLAEVQDRTTYDTEQDNQQIETALNPAGALRLQWRPKVASGQIDQSLTARSSAVFDIQEDGLRLTWRLMFDFGSSPRETVSLAVPADWLVEGVRGENVRGWQVVEADAARRIDVTLLKATTGQESVTVQLARREPIGQDASSSFTAPVIGVPNAVLHQGHLAIRRSPRLDVRTEQVRGVARAESTADIAAVVADIREESPLGITPFQTFRFASANFAIDLTAVAYPADIRAEVQALLRIGDRETNYEARVVLQSLQRPLHEVRLLLPVGFELDRVEATGVFESAVTDQDGRRLLTVYLAEGYFHGLSVVVAGRLPAAEDDRLPAPQLEVLDADRQRGHLVVQSDPGLSLTAEQLRGCRLVSLDSVGSWLAAEQRALARLILAFNSQDFGATLRTQVVKPDINVVAVSNVRVTLRDIEETIYLQFRVERAGIRDISFLLPARMRDAVVEAPLLRRTTVDAVPDQPELVRMRVELQDEVTGELILLVKNDQGLTGDVHAAPIPEIETGTTLVRYVVLENAGRDEIVIADSAGVVELRREDPQWQTLTTLLGDRITQSFVATRDAAQPSLSYQTRRRSVVVTAGASIRLAETMLAVDADGVYRAEQTYRLDNQTEQALEIELPEGAQLWTVTVAGEPVKPTEDPDATSDRFVRIPLFKTAPGDLDFAVQLKYGGRMQSFGPLAPTRFPLVRTVNVKVELSQVRLLLPRSHRFFDFGGTLRRVTDEGDFQAGFLAYKNRQIESLMSVLSSRGKAAKFSQMRAASNLRQLGQVMQDYGNMYDEYAENDAVRQQLESNSAMVRDAQRQLAATESPVRADVATDNRARFDANFQTQGVNRAKGIVIELGSNFFSATEDRTATAGQAGDASFNSLWLDSSGLNAPAEKDSESAGERLAEAGKMGSPQVRGGAIGGGGFGEGAPTTQPHFGDYAKQAAAPDGQPALVPQRRDERVDQFERYQSQLDKRSSGVDMEQGSGLNQIEAVPNRGNGARRRLSVTAVAEGAEFRMPRAPASGSAQLAGMPGDDLASSGFTLGEAVAVAADSGLASLEVTLPQRGVEYLFTTPGGDLEITARAVDATQFGRLWQLMLVVAGLLTLWALYRLVRLIHQRLSRRAEAVLLILGGLFSLLAGILPIIGLLAMLTGVGMLIATAYPTISARA